MKSPFLGMDPYLEQKGVWGQVHTELIVGISRFLTPILRPKYRVAIEQRNYLAVAPPDDSIGEPDIIVSLDNPSAIHTASSTMTATTEPLVGHLPLPQEIKERFLEIRLVDTQKVVTVIEVLSPSNKRAGDGRDQYEKKRSDILGSQTNLIEIDLLRAGRPMPMNIAGTNHYRMIVSRAYERPRADFYLFSVRDLIPSIPIPLLHGDEEPLLDLNHILHDLYELSAYDMFVKYDRPPPPPAFSDEDSAWIEDIIRAFAQANEANGHGTIGNKNENE